MIHLMLKSGTETYRKYGDVQGCGCLSFVDIYCYIDYDYFFNFSMTQEPPLDQGLLILEISLSHSKTPQSVGFLCKNDRPDAETCT